MGQKVQAIKVSRNIEEPSCNHYCSREAVSITYSECVLVAFGIQPAMRLRHIVLCDLSSSTVFFFQNYHINDMLFEK